MAYADYGDDNDNDGDNGDNNNKDELSQFDIWLVDGILQFKILPSSWEL